MGMISYFLILCFPDPEQVKTVVPLVGLLLFFTAGIVFPIQNLLSYLQPLCSLNPFGHSWKLTQLLSRGQLVWSELWLPLMVVIVAGLMLFWGIQRQIKQVTSRR